MTLIVLFNLKDAAAQEKYEHWAQTVDVPTVKRLSSIDDFVVFKNTGLLMGDGQVPFQYVEIIEVNDMDQFGKDVSTDKMKEIAGQFQSFADGPIFMTSEQIA